MFIDLHLRGRGLWPDTSHRSLDRPDQIFALFKKSSKIVIDIAQGLGGTPDFKCRG